MAHTAVQRISPELATPAAIAAEWWQGIAVLAAAGLTIALWALTPVATRFAAGELDGVSIGLVRTMGAGTVAAALLLVCRMKPPRGWLQWRAVLLSAGGSFAIGPVMFSYGTAATSAAHAALIMAAMPLFAGLIAAAIERRPPSSQWIIGVLVAFVGESALIGLHGQSGTGGTTLAGDLCVLLGSIAWGGGFVAGAHATKQIGPWRATYWALVLASLALAPLAPVYLPQVHWSALSPHVWAALLQVSLGSSLLAYICWYWALAEGGIAQVAVLLFAQPPLALVLAVLLLGERMNAGLAAAGCAIVAGVVLARRR